MFSLASGVYQSYFATPQINVLLIGMEGVGKTTLLERLKVTQFSKYHHHHPTTTTTTTSTSLVHAKHSKSNSNSNTNGDTTNAATRNTTKTSSPSSSSVYARAKRSLTCPAPSKYANAKVMDDDDDDDDDEEYQNDDDHDDNVVVVNNNNTHHLPNYESSHAEHEEQHPHSHHHHHQQQEQQPVVVTSPPQPPSRTWLSERDHSSMEDVDVDVEWTNTTSAQERISTTTRTDFDDDDNDQHFIRECKEQEPIEQQQQHHHHHHHHKDNKIHQQQQQQHTHDDAHDEEVHYRTEVEVLPVEDYNLKPNHKMLPLEKIRPTSGQNLAKIEICGAKCHIFDLCGKFRDLWGRYYNDAEAVIFCWNLKGDEMQQSILEAVRKEISDDVPILIFGHVLHPTISDVDFPRTLPTEVFLPNYHSNLMQGFCGSAKTGKGVREAMEWLIPLAKRQAAMRLK